MTDGPVMAIVCAVNHVSYFVAREPRASGVLNSQSG
jgi:hypothetical protein